MNFLNKNKTCIIVKGCKNVKLVISWWQKEDVHNVNSMQYKARLVA